MEALEQFTFCHLLKRTVAAFPNHYALAMVNDTPITYSELNHQVEELIEFMYSQGIAKGDRVAILSENMPNWGIAYFAITCMGAVVVPILKDFHSNEIHHILNHSETKMVFISVSQYGKLAYEDVAVKPIMVHIDTFTIIPPETHRENIKDILKEGSLKFARLKAKALKAVGLHPAEVTESDLAAIIYTSGTTGSSKGVMLTQKNIVYDAHITMRIQNVNENDKLISILPLAHTYECTIGFIIPMMQGACVYYLDKPPTARVLIPAMQKIRPTMILTVPLIIEKIFKMQIYPQLTANAFLRMIYNIPTCRRIMHRISGKKLYKTFGGKIHFFGIGGALLSPEVERFLWDAKFPYAIGYGLTETSPLIAGCTPSVVRYRATGVTLPGIDVKIDNPDAKTGEGEILVKGDIVMIGYYHDRERTRMAFTPDGWFKTGDLGVLKDHNYLYIKGRIKNVIIGPSGENIYPEEIESMLNEQESILESMVYSTESRIVARVFLNYEYIEKEFGIDKMSSVQAQKHIQKLLDQIRTQTNQRRSSYSAIHKIIEQKEPFEKTPTQKIKRFLYEN